jgi:hypothetical protein
MIKATKTVSKPSLANAKLVYVEWVDAVADCEWKENVDAEIHACRSIGWVVSETDDAICLANTISMESSNARIHIPKSWIKNRKSITLEVKKKKQRRTQNQTIISEGQGPSIATSSPRFTDSKV